jgi:calcium-independent phospholipase A2-gamma
MAAKKRSLMEGKMLYKDVAYKVFTKTSTLDMFTGASRMMWTHAYYDVKLWEKLLEEYVTRTRIIDTSRSGRLPKFCCVSTTVGDSIEAHIFRNYILPHNVESIYGGSHTAELWKVVRCSSAAPTYFGDYILNNQVHQDGGILYNNPCHVAIHEAKLLWPNEKICLVSMGTGRSLNKRKIDSQKLYTQKEISTIFKGDEPQTSSWKLKFMRILDAATDTEQSHHILSDLMEPGTYFRLNPYLTEMIPMTEYRAEKLRQIEKDAHMYFRRNEDKFEELAEILLKPRNCISAVKDMLLKNIFY